MSTPKRLVLIALGYLLAGAAGCAAVTVNELMMPADVAEGSPGMVAFGDMILFVLATGFFALPPSWFLLRLWADKAPRALIAAELAVAVMGPLSWLAVTLLALWSAQGGPLHFPGPQALAELLSWLIAFAAIPRMVFGPVLLVIEAITLLLVPQRLARQVVGAAMLMDIIPLCLFAFHMARSVHY